MISTDSRLLALRRHDASVARTRALADEFFGGIWFKIFSERGPSRRPL